MFSVSCQKLPANSSGLLSLFVLVFICNTSVYADFGHRNETRVNQSTSVEVLPVNLEILTLVELFELRKQHHSQLRSLQTKSVARHANEQKLLERLLAYDNVRLKIVDVIKSLIDEYKVHGEYQRKLLGYCQTFSTKIQTARNNVHTLAEYKVYGAHFALVYASLVYTFKENPDFYANYQRDIKDSESTLGAYINELNASYREVEQARNEYDAGLLVQQIERSIARLDREIVKHRTRLFSQHHGRVIPAKAGIQ